MPYLLGRFSLTLLIPLALSSRLPLHAKTIDVPDSFATLQAAVNAASPGDVIEVEDGAYMESVIVDVANLTLRASGAVIDAGYEGPCIEVLANGARVEGFVLVNGTFGISVVGDDVTVMENELRSIEEDGIEVVGDDATVEENELMSIGGAGIRCVASPESLTRIEKNLIDLCRGVAIDAIGGQILIVKNRIDSSDDGIQLSPTNLVEKSVVSKNKIAFCDSAGIFVDLLGAGVVIKKNDLEACTDDGILVFGDHSVISKNDIKRCEDEGIEVRGDDAVIIDNDVEDTGRFGIILIEGAFGFGIVADNDVESTTADGIMVEASSILVEDNEVKKCFGDGIDVMAGEANILVGNECERNAHEGIDNSGGNTIIEDNECEKNGRPDGPDIAGAGNNGFGTVLSFKNNDFGSGGKDTPQRLDIE